MNTVSYSLHNHTTSSDGELSPKELIRLSVEASIRTVAVTDHDSVAANSEAIAEGKSVGIRVIPGIELQAKHFEILGLGINPKCPNLEAFCELRERYQDALLQHRLAQLNRAGYQLTQEQIGSKTRSRRISINRLVKCLVLTFWR